MRFHSILSTVLLSTTCIPSAQAIQEYVVQKNKRMEATVSQSNLNRIAFDRDRIQQVFGSEGFDLEIDRKHGQVFIKPLSGKTLHLSLVTEKGLTQDLTLKPKKSPPQTIILKQEIKGTAETGPSSKVSSYHRAIKRLLQAIMTGEILNGFVMEEGSPAASRKFPGLEIESLKTYRGQSLIAEVYTVKNSSSTPVTLSEETIAEPGDRAISLSHVTLSHDEVSQIYIIRSERES